MTRLLEVICLSRSLRNSLVSAPENLMGSPLLTSHVMYMMENTAAVSIVSTSRGDQFKDYMLARCEHDVNTM